MRYALTRWTGTGTDTDPFRAIGADAPGSGVIDLRGDCTVVDGFALIGTPQPALGSGVVLDLGDEPQAALGTSMRQLLGNRLGVTLGQGRVDRMVLELLTEHARENDPARWKPLRPNYQGRLEVYLGGPLISMGMSGGASYSESWPSADNAALTDQLTWTELNDASWTRTGNRARLAGNVAGELARADHALASVDHYCQVSCVTFTYVAGALSAGPACRKELNATQTFYHSRVTKSVGTEGYQLFKFVGGAATQLGVTINAAITPTLILKVEANGSTIKSYVGGVQQHSVTDTAIAVGNYCGIRGSSDNASDVIELDDWSAADLAAVTGNPHYAYAQQS